MLIRFCYGIEIIGPALHHFVACWQLSSAVVSPPVHILDCMRQLALDQVDSSLRTSFEMMRAVAASHALPSRRRRSPCPQGHVDRVFAYWPAWSEAGEQVAAGASDRLLSAQDFDQLARQQDDVVVFHPFSRQRCAILMGTNLIWTTWPHGSYVALEEKGKNFSAAHVTGPF